MKLITLRIEPEILEEVDKKIEELKNKNLIISSATRSSVIRKLLVDWIKYKGMELTTVERLMEGLSKNE